MTKGIILVLLLISLPIFSQQKHPKLVVGIVVDQMRDEYLDRFYDDFGDHGFKRLIKEGYRFKNMNYNYVPTYTAPGHASIYTGTTPAYHGIISNEWYHRLEEKEVYCTSDETVFTLGNAKKEEEGAMSPRKLKSTTITDELKLATNFKGKVIGISIKDRGAILPAGHFADAAYWMSDNAHFISSSYYQNELPEWVLNFNNKKYYEKYLFKGWNLLKNASTYNESDTDENKFEAKLWGVMDAKFPYDFKKVYDKVGPGIIKATPFGNSIIEDFAKEAISHEDLGKDDITDFLAVSFSSPDYIGHAMGPRSMELQDMYLRLDETLADFLSYLDKNVGKGKYIVFLTADHACNENPNYMNAHKYSVTNLNRKEIKKQLEDFTISKFGKNFIKEYDNQNVYLDTNLIESGKVLQNDVIQSIVNYAQSLPYVKLALEQEVLSMGSNNFLVQMISNGYDPSQNGQIVLLYEPGYMEYGFTGTSHGTPYTYDTHVPMLWFGYGIPHGISYEKKEITEIAPTLSGMLHITFPNATQAKVLTEILPKNE